MVLNRLSLLNEDIRYVSNYARELNISFSNEKQMFNTEMAPFEINCFALYNKKS